MKRYAFLFVVILAVCGVAFGDTWYVDGANTSGTEDGLSWGTAFTVIQDGIAAAVADDEVWVVADTYPEGITLASDVSVYGGFDGTEENLSERDIAGNPTIIDAGGASSVVVMDSITEARIDGFIITGGNAVWGGGIYCNNVNSTNTIANCTIAGNSATSAGGGIMCNNNSSPAITNCTISGNSAASVGGGVYCWTGSAPAITNCVISGNDGGSWAGGVACNTGTPSASITNCTISANSASLVDGGGGLLCFGSSAPVVTNTIFEDNTNHAIYEYEVGSDPTVTNCLFYGNPDGDYYDEATTSYTGATDINTNIAEASGNQSWNPYFILDAPSATTGIWTDVTLDSGITTLTDDTASFTPAALVGKLINADTTQRQEVLIVANTATTVDVMGDVTGYAAIDDTYAVADYHIRNGSGAIDYGTGPRVLFYWDQCGGVDNVTPALANLGYSNVTVVTDPEANLQSELATSTWDLVVVDTYGNGLGTASMDALVTYHDNGGRIILFSYNLLDHSAHAFVDRAGVTLSGEYEPQEPVYAWVASPLFDTPNLVPDLTVFNDECNTDGQYVEPATATAHAGYTVTPTANQSAITVSANGRLILNAFAPQNFDQDEDDDGKIDMVELYENEIAFLLALWAADFDGEPRPVDVPFYGVDGTGEEYDIGADEFIDAEGDGLSDYEETLLGTDPDDNDTDDDGLSDGNEVYIWGTDPLDDDTDDDGLPDRWEVYSGLDPNDDTGDNGADGDPDGDGLTNAEEYAYNTLALSPDSDFDGVSDGDEVNTYGSDPNDSDTDDDGYTDGREVTAGSDPTDPDSYPVWYVDEDATGAADGTSWADAFTVIQDGIDAAAALPGQVWVADATYDESIVLASGVAVYGGFDGTEELLAQRDIANNQTVIEAGTASERTIGVGASFTNIPLATNTEDARSQVIYLSSEIGSARELTSLALDVSTVPGQTMNSWTIRMKHTSLSEYTTAAWEGSGWTTVYQNDETISSTGWVTFNFSTPFQYNGTDNVMIDFSFDNSSDTTPGFSSTSMPGGNRTAYYFINGGYGDPLAWSGTSNPIPLLIDWVPDIRLSDRADHVVRMQVITNARIDGFTITGGYATGAFPDHAGGGILCTGSSGTIANCTITGNSAAAGGGVYCSESSTNITNCIISGNWAEAFGGGVTCAATSNAVIANCTISENSAGTAAGGFDIWGGSRPSIMNCTISGNDAPDGGGVYCAISSSPRITNTILEDNTNHAIYEWDVVSDPVVTNCLFFNNNPPEDGDYYDFDTATTYGGAAAINGIPDGFATNNVDGDPLFVNKAEGDFHLRHGSPAIDMGQGTLLEGPVSDDEPNDTIASPQDIDGEQWTIEYSPDIGDTTDNTSAAIPHVTIMGTGDESFDVYSFTVANAGDRGIFDIDYGSGTGGTSVDCYLRLYDSGETMIAYDDDEGNLTYGQGGSTSALDSYLEHIFAAPGVYYIEVARFSYNPIPAGDDYQLQISLENHPYEITPPLTDFDGEPRPIDVAGLGANGTGEEFDIGADEYLDSDGDNLSDEEEEVLGTDPDDPDTDNDGADDGDEVDTHGTDPLDPDSDDDGLPDGWEVDNGFNPNDGTGDNGGDGDPDGDNLTNEDELANGTDPNDPDSDDDGLPDGWEVTGGLDPNDGTGDNGGGGDPDGDGLSNTGEYNNSTDPSDSDSDGDGLPDGWEVDNSIDPNDDTGDNGANGDPDGDGITNLEEYEEGYDPQLQAPVAAFSASVTSGIRPLAVDFTDESTGSITSRAWDLGDGYDSTAQNPSHTYYFAGDYTVTLTATGPGGIDSATDVIDVDQALAADARAYKAVINGIKVKYSKPTCFATYNDMQDSLLIAVWGDEPGALNVIATDEALLHWGDRCDVVIDAPDTYIKKINAKGIPDLLDLYVCGQVGYVKNFILKEGYVGDTMHYGEDFGLGSAALDPAKKILIKNGATTAPLFGIGYSALRAIPASVAEALANLEMEIRLKSKPFYVVLDDEIDEDDVDDEDVKAAELEFAEVEASVETKAAYVTEVNGVKVRYSLPGCVAYRNDDDGTLTIEITESGGNLLVKCGADAYLGWGDSCDVVIDAADTSVNTMVLKGSLETQLHVGGNVEYVKNFKLKYGAVGDTDFYGPEIGLGCTSLIPPNKILIQWGWTTAPLLGVSY